VSSRPFLFSGPYLDRRAEHRDDPDWLVAARGDPDTLFVLCVGATQLVIPGAPAEFAVLGGRDDLVRAASDESLTLLGWFAGRRCVLVEADAAIAAAAALPAQAELRELRPLAPQLAPESAALLAYVRALSYWKARHRFCGVCGAANRAARAGHVMRCTREGCGTEAFPRLDPAIIVLVTDPTGDRALLGRQASWPPGRYSTIAGFVEPGETLEDAVAREVLEETGVETAEVQYAASQPWPFPSSLMLGFNAVARTVDIHLRDGELEDARWFSREDIARGVPALPPPGAISARLIDAWRESRPVDPGGNTDPTPPRRW
jgi:NAD+ diphosphatase